MASYKVVIASSAIRELATIPKKDRARIGSRMKLLAVDPRPPGHEKLTGLERYRVRQGDYRVVYTIDDSGHRVDVVKIGHRKEVYR